jgi:hypothetical protein
MKRVGIVVAALLVTAACSNDSNSTTAPSTTSPVTETVTTVVTPLGLTSHAFTALASGTLTAVLTSANPPPSIVVGFGIGIPQSNGSGCALTIATTTAAGPGAQISSQIDAGRYCFAVYDVGNLTTQPVSFTVTVTHP